MDIFKNLKIKKDMKLLEHLNTASFDEIKNFLTFKIQTAEGVMRSVSLSKR